MSLSGLVIDWFWSEPVCFLALFRVLRCQRQVEVDVVDSGDCFPECLRDVQDRQVGVRQKWPASTRAAPGRQIGVRQARQPERREQHRLSSSAAAISWRAEPGEEEESQGQIQHSTGTR